MKQHLHVTPQGDRWAIKQEGKDAPESTHETRQEAIEAAETMAIEQEVNVIIHREDGTFRSVRNFSDGNSREATLSNVNVKDLLSVGSRVSWGALLAGAVVSLSAYVSLGLFGIAIGFTVNNNVDTAELVIGTVIWGGISMLIALFLGGFVTSRTTVGENKAEALIYGVLHWGVLLALLLQLTHIGLDNSFSRILMQTAEVGGIKDPSANLGEFAQSAGIEPGGISPRAAAWWAFVILVTSLMTSIVGSLMGAGPELVLQRIRSNRASLKTKSS